MGKKVAIAAAGLIAVLLLIVATRPAHYKIERSLLIAAPAETIFAEISDFQRWTEWSPWEKLDPDMQREYTGEPGTVGAAYRWKGNQHAGSGQLTITEVDAPHRLVMRLQFYEPWETTVSTVQSLTPEGDAFRVSWSMEGEHNFVGKAIGLFMNMDAMIGSDYEKGLQTLKALAEDKAKLAQNAHEEGDDEKDGAEDAEEDLP